MFLLLTIVFFVFFLLQESLLEEFGLVNRELEHLLGLFGLSLRESELVLGKAKKVVLSKLVLGKSKKLVLSNFKLVTEGSDLDFMLAASINFFRRCRV